ncbi:MAG: Calx-beta domain-containing protein, partial [Pyrinomonadaceae bacterium]
MPTPSTPNAPFVSAKRHLLLTVVSLLVAAVAFGTLLSRPAESARAVAGDGATHGKEIQNSTRSDAAEAYGKMPLLFEANAGQTDERVRFISRGVGYNLFLTRDEAVLALRERAPKVEVDKQSAARPEHKSEPPSYRVLRMRLDGAQAAPEVEGLDEQAGKYNYFVGADPAKWRTGVPVYGKVKFDGVYKGIDLVYYGNQRQLEYDFNVAPGADPRAIRLRFEGAERARVDDGDLVLELGGGEVRMRRPFIYQTAEDGGRHEVEGRYVVRGRNTAAFEVGTYDRQRPLVIDPILSYSTYLGAAGNEIGYGIAADATGSAYVTGETSSVDFPVAGQTFISPTVFSGHVFVTKLNPAGSSLVYSTLVGGTAGDRGAAIAIDAAGSAYVTGATESTNFPVVNPLRGSNGLIKSTNAGGSWASSSDGLGSLPVTAVAVVPSAPSVVYAATFGGTGVYKSTDGGATWNSLNTGIPSAVRLVIDPLNPSTLYAAAGDSTTVLIKSTDGGATWAQSRTGINGTGLNALAIDPSTPTTLYAATFSGLYKTTNGGANWALAQTGLGFGVTAIAVDPTNSSVVYAGNSIGGVFKTTNGGANWTLTSTGLTNTAVRSLVIDPTDSSVVYAATNGGGVIKTTNGAGNWGPANNGLTNLNVQALALDAGSASTLYAGTTRTGIFKTTNGGANWAPVYSGLAGNNVVALASGPGSTVYAGVDLRASLTNPDGEAFVFKLSPAGNALVYSTYLGGSGGEEGAGIAVDTSGRAHVTGTTGSTDFPLVNPRQATNAGQGDAFAVKLDAAGGSLLYSTYIGGSGRDNGRAGALDPAGNFYVAGQTVSTNFPVTPGAFQTTIGDTNPNSLEGDAFVTKLDPTGSTSVYSTYLGGSDIEIGYAVAADSAGNAYVAGSSESPNFPVLNAAQTSYAGGSFIGDAFATKLNAAGSALVYSTYLGGTSFDYARGITVAPDGGAVVVGATGSYDFPVTADTLRHAGILWRSTDGAATWNNHSRGLRDSLNHVVFDPQTPTRVYALGTAGIFRSTDEGRTWAPWGTKPAGILERLAVDPQNSSIIYLTTFASGGVGIFKSTDGGATWSPSNGNLSFHSTKPLAIDPSNTNTIYIGSAGIYKSTNGGASWSRVSAGLPQGFEANSITIDPANTATLYTTGGSFSKLYKSIDGGGSWSPADASLPPNVQTLKVVVVPSNPAAAFALTTHGLFKSTDGGGTWALSFDSSLPHDFNFEPQNPSTLYISLGFPKAGSPAFVYKSTDGGATWQPTGGTPFTTFQLAINTTGTIIGFGNTANMGGVDAFAARLSPAGSSFVYSTYLGGQSTPSGVSADDYAYGVAVDPAGHAYVTGSTLSRDFVTHANPFQAVNRGGNDVFVAKLVMSFSIGGTVTNGATPQPGVRVTLTGDELRAETTGADGTYSFHNLRPGGNYTVSATKNGFTYTPPTQSFNDLGANQTVNFAATASASAFHTINGRVAEPNGAGVPSVNVRLTGSQTDFTVTNADGNYSFNVPPGGDYTVTPAALGFVFTPPSRSFNGLGGNVTGDFTAARQELVVTNTNDHGAGSLRQAVSDANAIPGADRIVFNIPGGGVKTIGPLAALPELTGPVVIDATTQPGYSGAPLVELDGANATNAHGLRLTGGDSVVRGLAIFRFSVGVQLVGNGYVVEGCYVGLNAAGEGSRPNQAGVLITGSNNRVGGTTPAARNVISGNSNLGLNIFGAGNLVKGNFIGTNPAGTAVFQNFARGIELGAPAGAPTTPNVVGGTEPGARNVISGNGYGVYVSSHAALVQGNYIGTDVTGSLDLGNSTGVQLSGRNATVGGNTPEARNVISGNHTGISVSAFVSDALNVIQGNYIGTDAAGAKALGNNTGIDVSTQNTTVGGTQPGEGNVISGNERGVYCTSGGNAVVLGNLIGTDAAGTAPVGNQTGVYLLSGRSTIGGTAAGAGNVISGNWWGIRISGNSNVVRGNRIGTDAAGTVPIANTQAGILSESDDNQIGGDAAGAGNLIAFNEAGVLVQNTSSVNNDVRGNSIFSNAQLGIGFSFNNAPTPNDRLDPDTGPNKLQNFPVLTSASSSGGSTHVEGTLNSTPNTQFRVDFYSNLACDASGNGEGARHFGSTTVTTNASGDANISVDISQALAPGRVLTATATDPAGNTSEFSGCNASAAQGSVAFVEQHFSVLEDIGAAVIRVVRTGGSRGTLTVNYSTGAGTATAGADYTPASGQLTFAEGETEKTFNIPIADDGVTEPEETVSLTLGGMVETESLGAYARATLHILDSNTTLTLVPELPPADGYAFTEGNAGTRNAVIPIRLSAATSRTVTVDYAAVALQPGVNRDFVPVSGTLTFEPGTYRKEVLIPIIGDTIDEFTEIFNLVFSNPSGATLLLPEVSVNILDDDAPPTLSVTDLAVSEGAGARAAFAVRLSQASGKDVPVTYSTADGTATAGSDYTATSGGFTFAAGQTVRIVEVEVSADASAEGAETFFLNVNSTNLTRATVADGQGQATIHDAASATSLVQFGATSFSVNEADGQAVVTVTRTGDTTQPASVDYRTLSQSASDRSDFTAAVGTLSFAAGDAQKTFPVLITDDRYLEPGESLNLELSNPSGAALGGPNVAAIGIT